MSLYDRIKEDGLPIESRNAIFRAEMIEYRNALDHEVTHWEATPQLDELCSTESSLRIYREMWGHIAENGFPTSERCAAWAGMEGSSTEGGMVLPP